MPSPFKSIHVLKAEGAEIAAESLMVPRWHLLVAWINASLIVRLLIDVLGNPTLLPTVAK